ncbi:MAG: HNH endonuclease [Ktedonobacterales bacterium]|nr:HNH endonuclease [Ktedonobacterales bacterium]
MRGPIVRLFGASMVLLFVMAGCATGGTSTNHQFGIQTKTSGCQAKGGLPDAGCTPGAIFPNATKDQICQSGYSRSVRNVPTSEKDQVYAEYGIASRQPGQYEVDHLVSLELGGSNEIANLWPELADPTPGFHQKDTLENYLHDQVCSGAMSLGDAQARIATNWLAIYQQMPQGQ